MTATKPNPRSKGLPLSTRMRRLRSTGATRLAMTDQPLVLSHLPGELHSAFDYETRASKPTSCRSACGGPRMHQRCQVCCTKFGFPAPSNSCRPDHTGPSQIGTSKSRTPAWIACLLSTESVGLLGEREFAFGGRRRIEFRVPIVSAVGA